MIQEPETTLVEAASDVELLQWLKNELAKSPANALSPIRPLKFEIEIFTNLMQTKNIRKFARILSDSNEEKTAEIIRKSSSEILKKSRQIYTERMNAMLKVFNTSMPYEQAYSQLTKLANDFETSDPAVATVKAFIPALNKIFSQKTFVETQVNALKAGIEILLERARTGQLPNSLPTELPKDEFSGKDFEYEITKDGFILHCRGKDASKNELYQYEFKLSK